MADSTLTISIIGNAASAIKALRSVVSESKKAGKESHTLGGKIAHGLGAGLKAGVMTTGAAVGGLLSASLFKGFNRLNAIEEAEAKLRGLGNSAKDIKVIMDNALKSVLGTSFGLGEAATTAAGAVAAGIKPGRQLRTVLDSVANAAASSGLSMQEMGFIYNSVATTGKAQNDVLRQVAEKGIPIYTALGKTLGVTGDKVFEMAKDGQIGFDQFVKGMNKATGSVAKELGGTLSGTFDNVQAAIGRFGASMLRGVFPMIQQGLAMVIPMVDDLSKKVGPFMDRVAAGLKAFFDALRGKGEAEKFHGNMLKIYNLGVKVRGLLQKVKQGALDLWDGFSKGNASEVVGDLSGLTKVGASLRTSLESIIASVTNLWTAFGPLIMELGSSVLTMAPSTFGLIVLALQTFSGALQTATKFMTEHKTLFQTLLVMVVTGIAVHKTLATAIQVVSFATKAYTVVAAALEALWAASGIGTVIVLIAALAAGLIYAYHHSETFRKVVDSSFRLVAAVAKWLWDQVKRNLVSPIINGFANMIDWIGNFLDGLSHIPGFGWAKDAANKMHGAARAARALARDIGSIKGKNIHVNTYFRSYGKQPPAKFVSGGVSYTTFRGYASGGTDIPAGLAWVGERGPELMYVPGGSTIWDADTSRKMAAKRPLNGSLAGSGVAPAVNVYVTVQGSVWAARDLAKELVNPIRDELVKVGRRNGGNIFPK